MDPCDIIRFGYDSRSREYHLARRSFVANHGSLLRPQPPSWHAAIYSAELLDSLIHRQFFEVNQIPSASSRMATSTPEYRYEPIHFDQNRVRLLKIPSSYGSIWPNVQFELQTFDLSSPPPYRALSYVWGPELPAHNILIDGSLKSIRQNLYDFLQTYSAHPRIASEYIWIDQICIDQQSLEEKGHQVQRMAHIFSHALNVIVWFGKEVKLQYALKAIRSLYHEVRVHTIFNIEPSLIL